MGSRHSHKAMSEPGTIAQEKKGCQGPTTSMGLEWPVKPMVVTVSTNALCLFGIIATDGYVLPSSLYKSLTPGLLCLLEFMWSHLRTKEVLQAFQELIDQTLRFRTSFVSESARLAQDSVWEQGLVPCVLCLSEAQACILVCQHLAVLVVRWLVFDPPTWCGAASTILCGGYGDPHP